MATNDASPTKGNDGDMNQLQTADDSDTPAARGQCYIDVEQPPFLCKLIDKEDTSGREDMTVEVWGETNHSEAKVYVSGRGKLPAGGKYRAGFSMPYLQACRLRDRLDDALQAFE